MEASLQTRALDKDKELNFVLNSWLRSFKNEGYLPKGIIDTIYFPKHEKIIRYLLNRSNSIALTCHLTEEPDVSLGFLIAEQTEDKPTIHYLFVKEQYRLHGVARKLLDDSGINLNDCFYTHFTTLCHKIRERYEGFTYDPYRL